MRPDSSCGSSVLRSSASFLISTHRDVFRRLRPPTPASTPAIKGLIALSDGPPKLHEQPVGRRDVRAVVTDHGQ